MSQNVLIVDDDDLNREIIAEFLSEYGASFDEAEDGSVAYSLTQSNDYDVIYMDLMMPVMDGLEATKRIRQSYGTRKHPRIVAVSAKDLGKATIKLAQAGFDDFIKKPFTENQILSHLA